MRGEQIAIVIELFKQLGSPPLARGTDNRNAAGWRFCGITPACAGNSDYETGHTNTRWDHPRLRGEQLGDALNDIGGKGSPPLARGTVYAVRGLHHGHRITPACAGNRATRGRNGRWG